MSMQEEILKLQKITGMKELEPDPEDLWSLYDAPHVRTLRDPSIFLSFARSKSTESVSCASVAGILNFRATGPHGGKVCLISTPSSLDSGMRRELRKARTEADAAGDVPARNTCPPYF